MNLTPPRSMRTIAAESARRPACSGHGVQVGSMLRALSHVWSACRRSGVATYERQEDLVDDFRQYLVGYRGDAAHRVLGP
jgi:hypothetical protein